MKPKNEIKKDQLKTENVRGTWQAAFTYEKAKPDGVIGCPLGIGATEAEAISDLLTRTNRESGTDFKLAPKALTATQVELSALRKQVQAISERAFELFHTVHGLDPFAVELCGDKLPTMYEARLRNDLLSHAGNFASDLHCLWEIAGERGV